MSARDRALALGVGAIAAATLIAVALRRRAQEPDEPQICPNSHFVALDGLRVHYTVAGTGSPPLLLLHGYAASVFTWHRVAGALAEATTVIAFDRPGFGLTDRPLPGDWTGDNPYRAETQADLTVTLLDALGIERAMLVGHSAGGRIAALAALRHPERVDSLVLVSPAIARDLPPPRWSRGLLHHMPSRPLGHWLARGVAQVARPLLAWAWHDPSRMPPGTFEGYFDLFRLENWDRAMWELALAEHALELEQRLHELTMPALVITGDDDRVVPARQSVELAAVLPDARLVVIPDCGHIPQEEMPNAFLAALLPFVDERRPGERKRA